MEIICEPAKLILARTRTGAVKRTNERSAVFAFNDDRWRTGVAQRQDSSFGMSQPSMGYNVSTE
jgi:hypothetical protein